jgi:energy-coupling factor transport system permease protein
MGADFDLYVRRDTWLHHLDPRVKLLFVVETSLLLFVWPTIWAALAAILLCSAAFRLAQIPRRSVTAIYRTMLPLATLVFALSALFGTAGDGNPVWLQAGPLVISPGSVLQGALLALRLLALALIIFVWLFTTDQASMVRGFHALRLPYDWALTLALALRYLPIFAGLFSQVRDAQQARGLDLEQRGLLQRLRAYRPVLVAMIINALRQSERLGWALEARALGAGGITRSVFRPLHLRRADYILITVLVVGLVISVTLRLI